MGCTFSTTDSGIYNYRATEDITFGLCLEESFWTKHVRIQTRSLSNYNLGYKKTSRQGDGDCVQEVLSFSQPKKMKNEKRRQTQLLLVQMKMYPFCNLISRREKREKTIMLRHAATKTDWGRTGAGRWPGHQSP